MLFFFFIRLFSSTAFNAADTLICAVCNAKLTQIHILNSAQLMAKQERNATLLLLLLLYTVHSIHHTHSSCSYLWLWSCSLFSSSLIIDDVYSYSVYTNQNKQMNLRQTQTKDIKPIYSTLFQCKVHLLFEYNGQHRPG